MTSALGHYFCVDQEFQIKYMMSLHGRLFNIQNDADFDTNRPDLVIEVDYTFLLTIIAVHAHAEVPMLLFQDLFGTCMLMNVST